jgi:hypothetical protein
MKLSRVNDIAEIISAEGRKNKDIEVVFTIDGDSHESLQQEVYKFINKTIHGYTSKSKFEIIMNDIRFVFKAQ